MSKAIHICFEGTEGCFKTTNVQSITSYLKDEGYSVLKTKEPGTDHIELTMILRSIMLDSKYESQMTHQARELISQAIRSIHTDKLLIPAKDQYDYIIQDRGILSALAYGMACGNTKESLLALIEYIGAKNKQYDLVIYLDSDSVKGLDRAKSSKREFESGDAMENKGLEFIKSVEDNFKSLIHSETWLYDNLEVIDTTDKTREQLFNEIVDVLNKHNLK